MAHVVFHTYTTHKPRKLKRGSELQQQSGAQEQVDSGLHRTNCILYEKRAAVVVYIVEYCRMYPVYTIQHTEQATTPLRYAKIPQPREMSAQTHLCEPVAAGGV